MKQVKIWTLGAKNTNADKQIYWGSALPNYADTDILIVDLTTLTHAQLKIINKKDLQATKEAILDKCMNGGKIIFITTPYISITLQQEYVSLLLLRDKPVIHHYTYTNYHLSPISLNTKSVPEGKEIFYDEQETTGHPFGSYLSDVKKFKFYLTDFDQKKIKETGTHISILENYGVKDGSGHFLGIGFEIEPGKGQVIFLPPPNLISMSDAINKIIEKLREGRSDHVKKVVRSYFSERSGKIPEYLSLDHLKSSIDIIYRQFITDGYFQKAFGFNCVDAGSIPGDVKVGIQEQLILVFGERGKRMIPTTENIMNLDIDTLFDLIEFLHDYISKPIDSEYHGYNDCGIHVKTSSREEGQKEWRIEINNLISRLDNPFRITDEGHIETFPTSEGLRNLIDNRTLYNDTDNVDHKVEKACHLFLGHNSTTDNKKFAIRELADVLEFLRNEMKNKVYNKEESEIFTIANNFGIRHHNDSQKTEYDREVFYPWIFYAYLNTIDLLSRLKKKDSNT